MQNVGEKTLKSVGSRGWGCFSCKRANKSRREFHSLAIVKFYPHGEAHGMFYTRFNVKKDVFDRVQNTLLVLKLMKIELVKKRQQMHQANRPRQDEQCEWA